MNKVGVVIGVLVAVLAAFAPSAAAKEYVPSSAVVAGAQRAAEDVWGAEKVRALGVRIEIGSPETVRVQASGLAWTSERRIAMSPELSGALEWCYVFVHEVGHLIGHSHDEHEIGGGVMREARVGRPLGWRYGPCVRRVAPKIKASGARRWARKNLGSSPRCRVVARDSARCVTGSRSEGRRFHLVRRVAGAGYRVSF